MDQLCGLVIHTVGQLMQLFGMVAVMLHHIGQQGQRLLGGVMVMGVGMVVGVGMLLLMTVVVGVGMGMSSAVGMGVFMIVAAHG